MASMLQQNMYKGFAGNPNGNVAGFASSGGSPPSMVWDTADNLLWVCTTTGNAASATWSQTFSVSNAPTRIVTASTTLNLNAVSDQNIGLLRQTSPATMTVNLAASGGTPTVGKSYKISDLSGNMDQFPVTIAPPGGHTIVQATNYVMNQQFQSATFTYYGSSVWDVASS
jgi:hypothetical protein